MYPNLTLSVLLMIHRFIPKLMMYLIVTYCNNILIIYMTGHPLITCFNSKKFHYITFSSKESSCLSNMYINPKLNIINPSSEVLDLGVYHYYRFIVRFPIWLDFPLITFLRPDALPDINHMRGMQYQIVLNIIFWSEIN